MQLYVLIDGHTERQAETQTDIPRQNTILESENSNSTTIPARNVGTRILGIQLANPEFVEDACLELECQELTYVTS